MRIKQQIPLLDRTGVTFLELAEPLPLDNAPLLLRLINHRVRGKKLSFGVGTGGRPSPSPAYFSLRLLGDSSPSESLSNAFLPAMENAAGMVFLGLAFFTSVSRTLTTFFATTLCHGLFDMYAVLIFFTGVPGTFLVSSGGGREA